MEKGTLNNKIEVIDTGKEHGPAENPSNLTPEELQEQSKMNKKVIPSKDYKKEKFIALFQARTILSKHGTMKERQICGAQLKRMKKLGIKSL